MLKAFLKGTWQSVSQYLIETEKNTGIASWQSEWSQFLTEMVTFYRVLSVRNKRLFEQRVALFWQTTAIIGTNGVELTCKDRLLVAASAIIPVWGFPSWHYFNLKTVQLLPSAFNADCQCGMTDSRMTGLVGTGHMSGIMMLSKPDLHKGFMSSGGKCNVGIHEFVHLVDRGDGQCDGIPKQLQPYPYSIHWLNLVARKIEETKTGKTTICPYASTRGVEFFTVVSEYFFERPARLRQKQPELFLALEHVYQQDVMAIADDIQIQKKSPCYCGSNKQYRYCCIPKDVKQK